MLFRSRAPPSTIPAHRILLDRPEFVDGSYTTGTVEGGALDALVAKTVSEGAVTLGQGPSAAVLTVEGNPVRLWHPAMAASAAAATSGRGRAGHGTVVAPMHGTILHVLVAEGDLVEAGATVAILEAMKMETQLTAPAGGTVKSVDVEDGDIVESGRVVAVIE